MTTNPPSISVRPDVRSLLQRPGRVVLVAPHPDDEVLALGGSLAMLARSGREVLVVAVTDGTLDSREGHGEFVAREPRGTVNRALSAWKELTAPRPVERSGIPASGV